MLQNTTGSTNTALGVQSLVINLTYVIKQRCNLDKKSRMIFFPLDGSFFHLTELLQSALICQVQVYEVIETDMQNFYFKNYSSS